MTRITPESFPDAESLAVAVADRLDREVRAAVSARGVANVALSGGRTYRRAYELLAERASGWRDTHLWYADERCVPPDDPESTHRLVVETLLAQDPAGVTEHRILGELDDPDSAARAYAGELRSTILDVVLLGLGEDGHTASLFPYSTELDTFTGGPRVLAVRDAPKPPPNRVTLTLETLGKARALVLAASGEGKRDALRKALGSPSPATPASLLRRDRLTVLADADALGRAVG
ncbi:6-phosphogluconolactonase [Conexibacter sp. W3-3-2]|uniref:6-phosphogluconolactonase n=1 Tax=Conexibacter sp. W3-3-2 TaxID=2675227 RepID=UPI00132C8BAB|nr:6-phosphogluconolactonase [Conexibacter sp. W3-3-2]MTD46760.1 6-phosphogluconolactonase [Conexibacter sp. W3-3-2]